MGVTPALRAVPPAPATRSGDPSATWALFFGVDLETVTLATVAAGLGIERHAGTLRVAGTRDDLERLAGELNQRSSPLAPRVRRLLNPEPAWKLRTRTLPLTRPIVMGILNLTDDSFSGDGVGRGQDAALAHAERLRTGGAQIIDVGGESARANRPVVEPDEEAAYVAPVVEALVREGHCVSVDTYKAPVAAAALEAGAEIVNDISGLTAGTGAAEAAISAGAGYVLNYSYSPPKRRPATPPAYEDVTTATLAWMETRLAELEGLGLASGNVAIDPGIAFGKSHDEDLQVLRRLGELATFGLPVLLAHSRKNYIGSITGQPPGERDIETHISTALAYERGARIFRVHDVAGAARALATAHAFSAEPGAYAPDAESWPWRGGAAATHATAGESTVDAPPGQRW